MVRGDILGGLKSALARGSSLQDAMQSFYNSGYKKEDIEEAARALTSQPAQPQPVSQTSQLIQKQPQTRQQTPQQIIPQPSLKPIAQQQIIKPTPPLPPSTLAPKPTSQPQIPQPPKPNVQPPQAPKPVQPQSSLPQKSPYSEITPESLIPLSSLKPAEPQEPKPPMAPPPVMPQAQDFGAAQTPKQIISTFGPPKKRIDFVTILLIIILVVLIGVLALVFFFKEPILAFLNQFLE